MRVLSSGLLLGLLFSGPALAKHARLDAPTLSPAEFLLLQDPVALDRRPLEARLKAMKRDLKTMKQMLELVRDKKGSKVLRSQIEALQASLDEALQELRTSVQLRPHLVRREPIKPPPIPRKQAATGAQMSRLMSGLQAASFRDDKMRIIRSAAKGHHFTCKQVARIVATLPFSEDKVEAIAALHPRLVDPANAHTLYQLLPHASDREALEQRLR